VYLVAEDKGKLVDIASLRPMVLRATAHVYRLSIMLALTHVSRGIGTRLMRSLMARAKRLRSVRKIELLVRASNRRAHGLYGKFGFHLEGRLKQRVSLPDGTFVDDLSMAWFPRKARTAARR
jgi:ribosomal protein S18 acetylase RimI-like enzyme